MSESKVPTQDPEVSQVSTLKVESSSALEPARTDQLKKVVKATKRTKGSELSEQRNFDLGQNAVNPESNVFVVQVGARNAAPRYLNLCKDRLSSDKFQRICIEAVSVDCNPKAMRVANSLVRWGYG